MWTNALGRERSREVSKNEAQYPWVGRSERLHLSLASLSYILGAPVALMTASRSGLSPAPVPNIIHRYSPSAEFGLNIIDSTVLIRGRPNQWIPIAGIGLTLCSILPRRCRQPSWVRPSKPVLPFKIYIRVLRSLSKSRRYRTSQRRRPKSSGGRVGHANVAESGRSSAIKRLMRNKECAPTVFGQAVTVS